jgi:beta-aspartyl-peptidase (threonine type)
MRKTNLLAILLLMLWSVNIVSAQQKNKQEPNFAIVIHGGAGTILKKNMTPEKEKAYHEKMQEALQAGYAVLKKGGTSVEAVEAAIRLMEDSPLFNAGKGAVFTNDKRNELDAAVMDGKNLMAGSIAGVNRIKNPISAAIKVMTASEHVMMVGAGAEKFAQSQGIELVDPSYFRTDERLKQLERIMEKEKMQLDHDSASGYNNIEFAEEKDKKFGTVGAVALDKHGNLAAGTSTGGMTNKRYGRVGDVPIIGAGTYANNNTCAVSATGHGEFFIRYTVAHDISALMEYKGMSLKAAADKVIMDKLQKAAPESGGVIAIDRKGNIAMPFNSAGMYRGFIKAGGKAETFIYKQ